MMDELRKKLLLDLDNVDGGLWRKRNYDSYGKTVLNWLPVTALCRDQFLLGLTSEGLWARATENATQVADDDNYIFFLPVIEETSEIVFGKIAEGLKYYGLSEIYTATFPFEDVVVAGLRSQSEHWSDLALKWVLFLPCGERLKIEVESLIDAGETQSIRHTARKIAKRLMSRGEV